MTDFPKIRVGLGQDSHRFLPSDTSKPCTICAVIFEDTPGLAADSDGDVALHAICNAITSVTGVPILGGIAIDLCHKDGITDSRAYLKEALKTLGTQRISHLSLSLEGKRPHMQHRIDEMRKQIADLLQINVDQVGITATSGDGLTEFGLGNGLQCFCLLTTVDIL